MSDMSEPLIPACCALVAFLTDVWPRDEFVCEFAFTSLVCSYGGFYDHVFQMSLAFLTLRWYSAVFGAVIIWI